VFSNEIAVAFIVNRGHSVALAKSTMSPAAISVQGPLMLSFEPDSSNVTGSRPGESFAVVNVRPVTMVAPTAGVTWIPVGRSSPLKCRNFVLAL